MILGIIVVAFPIYYTFVASTHTLQTILRPPLPLLPGPDFFNNYSRSLFGGGRPHRRRQPVDAAAGQHHVVALGIAVGKIASRSCRPMRSCSSAFRSAWLFFWLIFITLMLPVEVRILPTYKVMVDLGLIDTYAGLTCR
jgi:sn-glycerol 3-phosphate transport system permease protein